MDGTHFLYTHTHNHTIRHRKIYEFTHTCLQNILACSVRSNGLIGESAQVRVGALQPLQLPLSAEASRVIFAIDPSTVM